MLVTPLMVVGDDVRLRLRVDIDENDAGRVDPSARAVAFVRGRPELRTDLRFESIEPYVAPKRSLTGDATERVDTRVLQVVYTFERAKLSHLAAPTRPLADGDEAMLTLAMTVGFGVTAVTPALGGVMVVVVSVVAALISARPALKLEPAAVFAGRL